MPERSVIAISAHHNVGKIDEAEYFRLYQQSLADPDRFWGDHGKRGHGAGSAGGSVTARNAASAPRR